MPPQQTKQQELEQQKLLEQQQQREEEERIAKEEEKKYGAQSLPTGLVLILTPYYVTEAYKVEDPRKLTREFITRYFKKNGIEENFREIDIVFLVDFHLFNLSYSLRKLRLDELNSCLLINIFWAVLMHQDPRYQQIAKSDEQMSVNEFDALRLQLTRESKQNPQNDFDFFKILINNHSFDKEPAQVQFFNSIDLIGIFQYYNSSYMNHVNLFNFVAKHQRRAVETSELVVVDQPQDIPPLHFSNEIIVKDEFQEQLNEQLQEEERKRIDAENQYNLRMSQISKNQEEEEEEPLDPVSLEIIREKVLEYEQQLQSQLQQRRLNLDKKVQDLAPQKAAQK